MIQSLHRLQKHSDRIMPLNHYKVLTYDLIHPLTSSEI